MAGGAVVLLGFAAAGGARGETYHWMDERGQVHYSNVPADGGAAAGAAKLEAGQGTLSGATRRRAGERAEPVEPHGAPASGTTAAPADERPVPSSTADAALGRNALDTEERRVRAQLAAVESELDRLGRMRLAHAEKGHESVGGVTATGAAGARSEEELALEKEREELSRRLEEIVKRRADVTPRSGD
jgi:hypothetical protein